MLTHFTYLAFISHCLWNHVSCMISFKIDHLFFTLWFQINFSFCFFFWSGIVVRNTLVTYDRENDKLGFLKTNCSDLWRRLASPPDSPAPTSPVTQNKSLNNISPSRSPSPAPSKAPTVDLPGSLFGFSGIYLKLLLLSSYLLFLWLFLLFQTQKGRTLFLEL